MGIASVGQRGVNPYRVSFATQPQMPYTSLAAALAASTVLHVGVGVDKLCPATKAARRATEKRKAW